jgi:hypothetical protein
VINLNPAKRSAEAPEAIGLRYAAGRRIDAINVSNGRAIAIAVYRSLAAS